MTIRRAVLFLPNGKGTGLLFAQWKNKGGLLPIQAGAVLVDGGVGTRYLHTTWTNSFPSREPLPKGKLANRDGTATAEFWRVFA